MLRKATILSLAISALAAMALPQAAPATWKHHNTAIQQNISGTVTGNARFQGSLGGIECQATATALFFAGQTTGQIESYGADPVNETTNCKGLGGLAFCQVHNWTATELPWTLHTGAESTIVITSGQTHAQFTGAFCPVKSSITTPGTVTVTPNQPNTISSGQLSGTLEQHMQTNGGAVDKISVQISGTGNILAPNANTYSI